MRIQIYAVRTSERGADIPEIYQRNITVYNIKVWITIMHI